MTYRQSIHQLVRDMQHIYDADGNIRANAEPHISTFLLNLRIAAKAASKEIEKTKSAHLLKIK